MRIYVITVNSQRLASFFLNNDWSKDRLVRIINGVKPKDTLKFDELVNQPLFEHINKRLMSPGELGCAISHFIVYENVVREESPWSLILEDNTQIDNRSLAEIQELVAHLTHLNLKKPTMIHFCPPDSWTSSAPSIKVKGEVDLIRTFLPPSLTKAYLINLELARIAIQKTFPIASVADWPNWIYSAQLLITTKKLISINKDLRSDIGFRPSVEYTLRSRLRNLLKFITFIEFIQYKKLSADRLELRYLILRRFYKYVGVYFSKLLVRINFRSAIK